MHFSFTVSSETQEVSFTVILSKETFYEELSDMNSEASVNKSNIISRQVNQ